MEKCPNCGWRLDEDTELYTIDGVVVGCDHCVQVVYADERYYTQALQQAQQDYIDNVLWNKRLDDLVSTLAKSAQSAASKSTTAAKSTPTQTVTGVRIGNDSTVYTSGEQLLQAFKNMGFTKEEAIAYAAAQGVKIEG